MANRNTMTTFEIQKYAKMHVGYIKQFNKPQEKNNL